jgi:hypothetical protein
MSVFIARETVETMIREAIRAERIRVARILRNRAEELYWVHYDSEGPAPALLHAELVALAAAFERED